MSGVCVKSVSEFYVLLSKIYTPKKKRIAQIFELKINNHFCCISDDLLVGIWFTLVCILHDNLPLDIVILL